MLTPLELSVIATLAYTDQFHYPLSPGEVYQRLVSPTALKSIGVAGKPGLPEITVAKVRAMLQKLHRRHLVTQQGGRFGLAAMAKAEQDYFKLRRGRAKIARARQTDWQELAAVVGQIPWVWGLAITGSTAMANATADSDLDVLVITAPGRLWLTRLLTIAISIWRRQRHRAGWCFNLWLEPPTLGLSPERQGVYEAYELWQCRWLIDRRRWRQAWLDRNLWFRQFLPQADLTPALVEWPAGASSSTPISRFCQLGWGMLTRTEQWWGDVANWWAYRLQTQYRHWRYREPIPPVNQAFLHQPAARRQIYARWQASLAGVRSK